MNEEAYLHNTRDAFGRFRNTYITETTEHILYIRRGLMNDLTPVSSHSLVHNELSLPKHHFVSLVKLCVGFDILSLQGKSTKARWPCRGIPSERSPGLPLRGDAREGSLQGYNRQICYITSLRRYHFFL